MIEDDGVTFETVWRGEEGLSGGSIHSQLAPENLIGMSYAEHGNNPKAKQDTYEGPADPMASEGPRPVGWFRKRG